MSQFRGMMDAVHVGLFGVQGEAFVYTRRADGAAASITAIVTTDGFNDRTSDDGRNRISVGTLLVKIADISHPEQGDIVTIDGDEWKVSELGELDRQAGVYTLGITRIVPIERSARGHRKTR